ncbi:hypothetical protein Celaphus_00006353 [Cervus elaphus hippelaphus]|uniref:Uncharacterized protein n=1 Tax=Cervus elaphus hippelaphus TaxID=46360 RepID=A0A212CV69_CEREH|nr:hypothetical protein Celaphus_00006353 [Cervus elaphus hippelaphus]
MGSKGSQGPGARQEAAEVVGVPPASFRFVLPSARAAPALGSFPPSAHPQDLLGVPKALGLTASPYIYSSPWGASPRPAPGFSFDGWRARASGGFARGGGGRDRSDASETDIPWTDEESAVFVIHPNSEFCLQLLAAISVLLLIVMESHGEVEIRLDHICCLCLLKICQCQAEL